jgi:hypothetical protein
MAPYSRSDPSSTKMISLIRWSGDRSRADLQCCDMVYSVTPSVRRQSSWLGLASVPAALRHGLQCDAISAATEFMVRLGQCTCSVATCLTLSTGERVNTREERYWSHACKSFKRAGMGGIILSSKSLLKPSTAPHRPQQRRTGFVVKDNNDRCRG